MRLLLHICCGPCALYPIKELLSKQSSHITGFFYNPNIHPPSEYKRRKAALEAIAQKLHLEVLYPVYKMEEYFRKIASKEDSPERCGLCWELRIEKTADFAKKNGFDAFTTTLLISPYQDHEQLKKISEKISEEKKIDFFYEDFRKGFKEGQLEAKTRDLYRQKYCGCVFSEG